MKTKPHWTQTPAGRRKMRLRMLRHHAQVRASSNNGAPTVAEVVTNHRANQAREYLLFVAEEVADHTMPLSALESAVALYRLRRQEA